LLPALVMGTALAAPVEFHGLRVEPPKALHGGLMLDQGARDVAFPLKGTTWQLVFFGYTHCPDICPMTLHKIGMLFKELGPDSARITPVFISIDSGRDNPEALRSFLKPFDLHAVGLSGDPEVLQAVANEFGVMVRRFQGKTALAYTLEHSSFLYLLDPQGRVRLLYPGTAEITGIASDLRRLWRDESMDGRGTSPGIDEVDRVGNERSRPHREQAAEEDAAHR
jgi:protein SCO1/2